MATKTANILCPGCNEFKNVTWPAHKTRPKYCANACRLAYFKRSGQSTTSPERLHGG